MYLPSDKKFFLLNIKHVCCSPHLLVTVIETCQLTLCCELGTDMNLNNLQAHFCMTQIRSPGSYFVFFVHQAK
jgi:hypothetical protein